MYRISPILSALTVVGCTSFSVSAAEVSREVSVAASAADVWAYVGPFCSISDWFPGIDSCKEEQIDGVLHRRLATSDGGAFLEKSLGQDDAMMSYDYAIMEGPLPVADYSAHFSVTASGDGSIVTWKSEFEPKGASEEEAVKVMTGIYDAGLGAIKTHFEP